MNKNLGPQVIKLKNEGNSYSQICKILGCSKGTVSYYCGENQKTKTVTRNRNRRQNDPIVAKLETFLSPTREKVEVNYQDVKLDRMLYVRLYFFIRRGAGMSKITIEQVKEKIGNNPKCYLTGKPINLKKPRTYNFDHIVPRVKGGTNDIENLGLVTKEANMAKGGLNLDEFLLLCKDILQHNGYEVNKL